MSFREAVHSHSRLSGGAPRPQLLLPASFNSRLTSCYPPVTGEAYQLAACLLPLFSIAFCHGSAPPGPSIAERHAERRLTHNCGNFSGALGARIPAYAPRLA